MMTQNYSNHARYYIPHHLVLIPLTLILGILSCIHAVHNRGETQILFAGLTAAFFLLLWNSFMMRAHYGLKNQDRIIRLEMRLRYFQLTGQRFEAFEPGLKSGQIAALRFAPDAELPALLQRAITESLPADEIKKNIRNWEPDLMRI